MSLDISPEHIDEICNDPRDYVNRTKSHEDTEQEIDPSKCWLAVGPGLHIQSAGQLHVYTECPCHPHLPTSSIE